MEKILLKNRGLVLGFGLILAMVILVGMIGKIGLIGLPNFASAATSTVSVSATVSEWLTFALSTSSVALTPNLVDTAGATHIASSTNIILSLGTNSADGWSVNIKSLGNGATGGLLFDSNLIATVTGSSTLTEADDDDGYGVQATTTLSGVTIQPNYTGWGTETVGQTLFTNSTLASKSTANASSTVATMKVKAESDSAQPNGSYTDTLTLTTIPAI